MSGMTKPGKIVCVGRNYVAHAAELGNDVPKEPLFFFKPPSAVIGPGEAIVLPSYSKQVESEAEIGVVIGRRARHVSEDEAAAFIRGFVCVNDVTARDVQKTEAQWVRAKGFDTSCPMSPMTPVEEAPPVETLEVFGRINGDQLQHGFASDMAFSIPFLISQVSRILTLEAGDVISTGTPAGVRPLAPGDTVEVEIPGVGTLSNPVVANR